MSAFAPVVWGVARVSEGLTHRPGVVGSHEARPSAVCTPVRLAVYPWIAPEITVSFD
jgi:hypothetical protein